MSNRPHTIMFVGYAFENEEEILDYLEEANVLTSEITEMLKEKVNEGISLEDLINYDYGFEDIDAGLPENLPTIESLNYTNAGGDGFYMGYKVEPDELCEDSVKFMESVEIAKKQWKSMFKEDAALCHDIQVV
jgi:hypothetical protein